MKQELENFVRELSRLREENDQDELISTLYDLTDMLDGIEGAEAVIGTIFHFMEALPKADLGSPGPLVHFIEQFYPNYDDLLLSSLERKPVPLTLWMCNRILNTDIEAFSRDKFLKVLQAVQHNELVEPYIRDEAKSFLERQLELGS